MTLWAKLTEDQKEDSVNRLQEHRRRLSLTARAHGGHKKKGARKTKQKKMSFKSPELEALFNSMPEEMKKKMFS